MGSFTDHSVKTHGLQRAVLEKSDKDAYNTGDIIVLYFSKLLSTISGVLINYPPNVRRACFSRLRRSQWWGFTRVENIAALMTLVVARTLSEARWTKQSYNKSNLTTNDEGFTEKRIH